MACCAGGAVVEPCAVGHYSDIYTDPDRPSCNICPPGTADDDRNPATPCTLCPTDTYSGEGATSCTVCPQGSSAQYSGKRVLPTVILAPCSSHIHALSCLRYRRVLDVRP